MSEWMGRLARTGFVLLFFVPFLLAQIFGWNLAGVSNDNRWVGNLFLSPLFTMVILLGLGLIVVFFGCLFNWIWMGDLPLSDDSDGF